MNHKVSNVFTRFHLHLTQHLKQDETCKRKRNIGLVSNHKFDPQFGTTCIQPDKAQGQLLQLTARRRIKTIPSELSYNSYLRKRMKTNPREHWGVGVVFNQGPH